MLSSSNGWRGIYCNPAAHNSTTLRLLTKRKKGKSRRMPRQCVSCFCDLQHSMGLEEACSDTVLPLGWLMCTRNTNLTRVFLRPMSVSPLRSSMSEFRSFSIPAQSILREKSRNVGYKDCLYRKDKTIRTKSHKNVFLFHLSNCMLLQSKTFFETLLTLQS